MKPEISVIIPFYNAEKTLERSVNSILSQDYQHWELTLVNDGSKDSSPEVAKSFLSNSRVSYLSQENKGVSAARNLGAQNAIGQWLIFLDADDQFRAGYFRKIEEEFLGACDFDYLVFGINRISSSISETTLPQDGKYFSKIPGTFVIRKSIFDQVGGYDERFRFSENTELFHRLALMNVKGKNIPWVSLFYFDNPTGGSKNLQNMVDSLSLFLEKHDNTLSNHVKHLFHQIIGVNYMRFGELKPSKKHFQKALKYKFKFSTLLRFGIANSKFLTKKIYINP